MSRRLSSVHAGAWIRTAEGWRDIGSAPQVVFERDLYGQTGPIDWKTWLWEPDFEAGGEE